MQTANNFLLFLQLTEIETIISTPDYLINKNDQSVVEICITRITSCIRETKTADVHCSALIAVLESCLKHSLQPSQKNEDPPHGKICADIISSIFLNYNKKTVMEIALPVAVKFLQKGNKELAKNLASYLSLAAIDYAYLLSPHVKPILDSVISGNYGLCRVLPQIYKVSPEPLVECNGPRLVGLLSKCDVQEKLALLNLFELIAKNKPSILESSVAQLCDSLHESSTVSAAMLVILKMAEERPNTVVEHFDKIKLATQKHPSTVSIAAKILAAAGKLNKERAQFALDFVLEQLPHTDRSSQSLLLNEATKLCSTYPVLFTDKVLACVRKRNNMNSQKQTEPVSKISGGVTIVKLNSTTQQGSIPNTLTSQFGGNSTNNLLSTTVINTSAIQTNNGHSHGTIPQSPIQNLVSIPNSPQAVITPIVSPTPPHTGYTRRAKLGDSRSTGRLSGSNTHRSMTRLNIAGGSVVGGLHKSMTGLSSSQQINQNGSNPNNVNSNSNGNFTHVNGATSQNYVTPVPPLSSNVIVTGHNK